MKTRNSRPVLFFFGIVALLILAIYMFGGHWADLRESDSKSSSKQVSGGLVSTSQSRHSQSQEEKRAPELQPSIGRHFARGLTLKKMTSSESLALLDYGEMRVPLLCSVMNNLNTTDSANADVEFREMMRAQRRLSGAAGLQVGSGSEAVREQARGLSRVACEEVFLDGRWDQAQDMALRSRKISQDRKALYVALDSADLQSDAAREALRKAAKEPALGAISKALGLVDTKVLSEYYPKEQVNVLQGLAKYIVLCRFGEDCGAGGLMNLNLCWTSGFCGADVESNIIQGLQDKGISTTQFSNYVASTYQAIANGDTSVLRKGSDTGGRK